MRKEMFCGNCGKALPDRAKFCPVCGTQRDVEPPLSGEKAFAESPSSNRLSDVDAACAVELKMLNILGYVLAFFPLIHIFFLQEDVPEFLSSLSLALWFTDRMLLKKYGMAGKWTWWGLIALPIYLYFRCKKVGENLVKFWCNIVVLILTFVTIVASPPSISECEEHAIYNAESYVSAQYYVDSGYPADSLDSRILYEATDIDGNPIHLVAVRCYEDGICTASYCVYTKLGTFRLATEMLPSGYDFYENIHSLKALFGIV